MNIRKKLLELMFLAVAGVGGYFACYGIDHYLHPAPVSYTKQTMSEPEIQGPPDFVQSVEAGLDIIRRKAPTEYENICKYVISISLITEHSELGAMGQAGYIGIIKDALDKNPDPYLVAYYILHETKHFELQETQQLSDVQEEEIVYKKTNKIMRNIGAPEALCSMKSDTSLYNFDASGEDTINYPELPIDNSCK